MKDSPPLPAPITVRVPASTSNLGPGFDFLGLALDLPLDVTVLGTASEGQHEFVALDGAAASWPIGVDNRMTRAIDHALRHAGHAPLALRMTVRSEIPTGRGFGSSGAATIAGLLLGHALARSEPAIEEVVSQGALLEGHPDNSTASLLGGCTLAVPKPSGETAPGEMAWRVIRQTIHPSIGFAIAWPERPLHTEEGRRALPEHVSFVDAVENPRRVAALLEGMRRGDPELLTLGAEDRLHVNYRLPLIPGAAEALQAARQGGAWLATISGSGSGLIALAAKTDCAAIASAMAEQLERAQGSATSRVVTPALSAPRVEPGSQLP
ncbi:MAG: homoserine kinase [Chlamydiales bacterium]|jgi:homoserine kinase